MAPSCRCAEGPSNVEHFNVAIVILDVLRDVSRPGSPREGALPVAARLYPALHGRLEPDRVPVDTDVCDRPVLVNSFDDFSTSAKAAIAGSLTWIEPVLHFLDLISAEVEGDRLLGGDGSWAPGNPSFYFLDLILAEVEGYGLYICQQ